MSIHVGNLQYDAEIYAEEIKSVHINRDYKKLISAEIRRED